MQDIVEFGCEVKAAPANGYNLPGSSLPGIPPHVQTGLVSLVSLECVRGDGVQVIHCGISCRLYLAGSPRGTAYERHPWRKGWPIVTQVAA